MSQHERRTRHFAALVSVLLGCSLLLSPVTALAAPHVFIDPGHGGRYSNANVNGVYEKQVTLLLGMELRRRLQEQGYTVGMTRTSDAEVCSRDIPTWHSTADGFALYADGSVPTGVPTDDLQARANLANAAGADLFVAIHCNGVSDRSVTGIETFAPSFDPLGQRLSALVQEQIVADTGLTDRGDKTTNFYVIRWTNMPAILIEAGFLSNPVEASKLASPIFRWRLARAIAAGIDRFLAEEPFQPVYPRLGGATRYDTAAKVSQAGWPNGARTVLLASGTNWPDALSASPLSRKLDAPLLLTPRDALPEATRAELARLKPSNVIVLGSEAAVSASVAAEATSAATVGTATVTAERIGGASRYDTAALIAERVGVPASGRIAIVSGANFPDALSLSPYAGRHGIPVLLANGATLPAATKGFIDARRPAVRGTLVVGDTKAVPPAALSGLPALTRISGPDRWTTNAAMVRAWGSGRVAPLVTNGLNFPDGLVAGAYGAKACQPLLLVQPRVLPDRAREFIELSDERIDGFRIIGSANAIPHLMDWQLQKALD